MSKFTHGELKNFAHAELSLDFSDLLDILKSENRSVPVETYEKLKALADRYNVQMPDRPKHHMSAEEKYALAYFIFQVIKSLFNIPDADTTDIENNYNINVYVSAPVSEDDVSQLCDGIEELIKQAEQ